MALVAEPTTTNRAQIRIVEPRNITLGAVFVVNLFGLLLALPIFGSVLLVSLLAFGLVTALMPLLALVASSLILPLGLGNAYVVRLVRRAVPSVPPADAFVVQLTLRPRIRSGLRAVIEDADDFGYLSFTATEMSFQGDAVSLAVPLDCLEQVRCRNVGLRGLFVYGQRIGVRVRGLPEFEGLEFTERASWLLPTSWKITRRMHQRLLKR